MKTIENLPNPLLITKSAKRAEMIFISSQGFCGEDDSECLGEEAPNTGEGEKVFFY